MQLTDVEQDKLRHLAIRRDVLAIADDCLAVPVLMLDTALSILAVGAPRPSPALWRTMETIQRLDHGEKVGFVLADSVRILPLLDLGYFDLVLYVARKPCCVESAGEVLSLLRNGCREDAVLAVLTDAAEVSARIAPFVARTLRPLVCVDRLSVLGTVQR